MFSDTPAGARSSAEIYSIIETAKANAVNSYHYLKYLLDVLPTVDFEDDNELFKVAPWNPELQATIEKIRQESIM